MLDAKPFINLMRRATRCRYSTVIMNNRMLMQCYDIAIDSEVGMNYILFIPDTDDYSDSFYDETLILSPADVLNTYGEGHKMLDEMRKAANLKTKDIKEELCFQVKKHGAELKFLFYMEDELVNTKTLEISYPIDQASPLVENCATAYDNLMTRVKAGGACLLFDGLKYDLQNKALECPEIYYFIVRYGGKRIRIPLLRSMFNGIKEVDTFYISLQESNLKDIFVLTLQYTKKGITEQFWGYMLHY